MRVGASNTAAGRLAMSPTERPRETARANLNFIDASTPARVRPDAGDPPYHIVLETLAVGRHKLADAMQATSFSIAIDLRSSSGTLTDHTVVDADSRLLQEFMARMGDSDFSLDGRLAIMVKDLAMIGELARGVGAPMPVTGLVEQLYRKLIADGLGERDNTEFVRLYRDKA